MSDWKAAPIGSLLQTHFSGEWGSDGGGHGELVRVYRGADFVPSGRLEGLGGVRRCVAARKLKKIALRHGDVLLEKSGGSPEQPVGRVSYFDGATGPAVGSNFLQTLRPTDCVDSKFFFFLLQHEYNCGRVLPFQQQTTGIINFRLSDYLKETVYVPSTLDAQRRISGLLTAADDQIASVEAEIAKRRLQFAGLQAELLSCRRLAKNAVDDVLLRQLVPDVQYGISTALESRGAIPVLRMNNLGGGEVDVSDLKYAQRMVRRELLLQDGDVLFNRTNSIEHVGRTSIWRSQLEAATFASYLVRLFPDETRISKPYLVCLLNWQQHQIQMRRYATTGVQQVNINPTNLRRLRVQIPKSLDMQKQIVEVLDAARECIAELRAETDKLRLRRKGLALQLLSGRR